MAQTQDAFVNALNKNHDWAQKQHPTFLSQLADGQAPQILWIGCSDSRCPETVILGLQPGEVFVHRNIANVVSPTDVNTSAVVEYAVAHLGVRHVVLCGHTGCGGAAAALGDAKVGGPLDTWLTPLRMTRRAHAAELDALADPKQRAVRLAERNVQQGVAVLMANPTVAEAVRDRGLQVHGVLFELASGKVKDLGCGTKV